MTAPAVSSERLIETQVKEAVRLLEKQSVSRDLVGSDQSSKQLQAGKRTELVN